MSNPLNLQSEMQPQQCEVVEKLKVHIYLRDGRSFWGNFYKNPGERLQDILNDERNFLPFERLYQDRGKASEDIYYIVLLAKEAISTVEER